MGILTIIGDRAEKGLINEALLDFPKQNSSLLVFLNTKKLIA